MNPFILRMRNKSRNNMMNTTNSCFGGIGDEHLRSPRDNQLPSREDQHHILGAEPDISDRIIIDNHNNDRDINDNQSSQNLIGVSADATLNNSLNNSIDVMLLNQTVPSRNLNNQPYYSNQNNLSIPNYNDRFSSGMQQQKTEKLSYILQQQMLNKNLRQTTERSINNTYQAAADYN